LTKPRGIIKLFPKLYQKKNLLITEQAHNSFKIDFIEPIILFNYYEHCKLQEDVKDVLFDYFPLVFFGLNQEDVIISFYYTNDYYPKTIYAISAKVNI
jgi:hypothetical protein